MDSDAKEILLNYKWPGNIRELSKVIFSLTDVKSGIVTREVVAKYFFDKTLLGSSQTQGPGGFLTAEQIAFVKENQSLSALQERIKNEFFEFALQEHRNNKNLISKNYRISRRSLFYYLKDVRNKKPTVGKSCEGSNEWKS